MKAIKLYEIANEYQFLVNELYDPETGAIDEIALQRLEELQDSLENKCINITKLFQSIERTQEAIKKEKERLANRERTFKKNIDRLKEYLLTNMDRCGIKKIEAAEFTISLRLNPPSVVIDEEKLVPSDFDKVQSREIDVAKVRQALIDGLDVPGAHLIKRKSVNIR